MKYLAHLQVVPRPVWTAAFGSVTQFDALNAQLADPDAALSQQDYVSASRELSKLDSVAELVRAVQDNIDTSQELLTMFEDEDAELVAEAKAEHQDILEDLEEQEKELIGHFLVKEEDDSRNAILEIRAGVGGQEASLFAEVMLSMYEKYCVLQGWSTEHISNTTSEQGGIKEARVLVTGLDVFGTLKYEVGGHRVQRVPVTESAGRTHTSAVTVMVLPEAKKVDVQIDERKELRIDTYRSSGKGGQHVNTTDSAVRITHLPTGLTVAIQDERSQHANKEKAMKLLYSRVYEHQKAIVQAEEKGIRDAQAISGDRTERIRTYNYIQGRITDHRMGSSKFGMDKFAMGDITAEFADEMREFEKVQALEKLLAESEN
jgi:peptide chain release factor 1